MQVLPEKSLILIILVFIHQSYNASLYQNLWCLEQEMSSRDTVFCILQNLGDMDMVPILYTSAPQGNAGTSQTLSYKHSRIFRDAIQNYSGNSIQNYSGTSNIKKKKYQTYPNNVQNQRPIQIIDQANMEHSQRLSSKFRANKQWSEGY